MEVRLIENIATAINGSDFDVVAIEMSPQLHLRFVQELLSSNAVGEGLTDRTFMGLEIIFVHEGENYYKLLNNELYRLRKKHNSLLGMYNEKYNRLKNIISNSYKIEDSNGAQFNQTAELESLVLRLNQIEDKMRTMSQ